jgi:glycosyltransferase involved in cell wall biosynthesis
MYLSIVIPTRNRSKLLANLINSLEEQNISDFDWEIIIVDNHSTDDTEKIVKLLAVSSKNRIKYFRELNIGLHYARHRGIRESNAEVLGFLDDDMLLSKDWIFGAKKLSGGDYSAVAGRIEPLWADELPPLWIQKKIKNGVFPLLGILDLGREEKAIPSNLVFGGNFFIKRQLILDLGGFNPDGVPQDQIYLRGDGETGLMKKFEAQGLVALYEPKSTVQHIIDKNRLSIKYLCKRSFNQGVSDSFSYFRSEKLIPSDYSFSEMKHLTKIKIKKILCKFKLSKESKLQYSYYCGYLFHRAQVKKDISLQEYVLRKNFL